MASIGHFINMISAHGGLSYSNNYDVEWVFPTDTNLYKRMQKFGMALAAGSNTQVGDQEPLLKSLTGLAPGNITQTDVHKKGMVMKYFCDEAQLPNISAATGQLTGRYLGEGQVSYPHTRVFTDFQLGWVCDADMTPLKFLNLWYGSIFEEIGTDGKVFETIQNQGLSLSAQKSSSTSGNNIVTERSVRLAYPKDYLAKCIITKTEKGANAPNSRSSMTYTLLDVYPYSIDSVPLSYGTSQATKVTANFYYSKHSVTFNSLTNYKG